jgi:transcriptional antiterminator RfaH
MQWYVVQTKPRQEERAQYFLAEKGLEAFLPKMEVVRIRGHRRTLVQKPLFPSYLFSRFDQQESLADVRWAKGVIKILPESSQPQSVDNEIVKGVMRLAQKDGVIRQNSLKRRDNVRIVKGPFKDLLGIFEHWTSDQGRVRVLLNVINYQASIELHHSMIEKIA